MAKKKRVAFETVRGRLIGERRKRERALTQGISWHVRYRDPLTKQFVKVRGQSVVPEIWVTVDRLTEDRTQSTRKWQKSKALRQRKLKRKFTPKQLQKAVIKDVLVREVSKRSVTTEKGKVLSKYPERRLAREKPRKPVKRRKAKKPRRTVRKRRKPARKK